MKKSRLTVPDDHVEFCINLFPGEIDADTMFALRSLAKQVNDAASDWLKPFNLTAQKFNYLVVLYVGRRPMTFSEIRESIHTSGASVTGMIKSLEDDALVARSENPGDARSAFFQLTRKGRRLVERVFPVHEHYMERPSSTYTYQIGNSFFQACLSIISKYSAEKETRSVRAPRITRI